MKFAGLQGDEQSQSAGEARKMDKLGAAQLELMLASEGGPHLSLFLPQRSEPLHAEEDTIRLSNQVREAETMLSEHWMTKRQAEAFLKPVHELANDSTFLAARAQGTAIYRSEDLFQVFSLAKDVTERLSIANVFRFRPILHRLKPVDPFYVLRIGKKSVQLVRVDEETATEVQGVDFPESFEQTLAKTTADRGSQTHSSGVAVHGKQGAVFHGQGGLPDHQQSELTEYLRRVDDSLRHAIEGEEALVVLAGVDQLTNCFRHASRYSPIAEQAITCSHERIASDDLVKRAIEIATAEGMIQFKHDLIRVREHEGPVATDPEQVLCAAHDGRIDALLIDESATLCGSFLPDTRTLREMKLAPTGAPEDPCHDLVEAAIIQTLRHRGRVHEVANDQMPGNARIAAALRY